MKIFDCTTFFKEKMMMDVRFNILDEYVSKFIVVESTFSHSGAKKELHFNINDYPKFKEKIEYIVIENEPVDLIRDDKLLKDSYISIYMSSIIASMAEWSKAVDLSSTPRMGAWVRTPLLALTT